MKKFKPYVACIGYKYRNRRKSFKKLYRPICLFFRTEICNCQLTEDSKLKFIKQLFRWFKKNNKCYSIQPLLKNKKKEKWGIGDFDFTKNRYNIVEGDMIYLSTWITKAGFKKLLSKIGFRLWDYKKLKRRKYNIFFTFYFLDIENKKTNITLDLKSKKNDSFFFFFTLGLNFTRDINRILTVYHLYKFKNLKKI